VDGAGLPSRSSRWYGYLAAGWATVFAGAHFFWALGGETGLDISAGQRLADERPGWFVAGGLWGVGPAQKFWTLALWNPWFILGGVLFAPAARSFGKGMAGEAEPRRAAAH
jgi:hypothetical protein